MGIPGKLFTWTKKILHLLILVSWVPLDAVKTYEGKTDQKLKITEVKIAWDYK